MDGLIVLLALIPVVFLILLISVHSKTSVQKRLIDSLNEKMDHIANQLSDLTKFLKEREQKTPEKIFPKESIEKRITPISETKKEIPVPETKPIPEKKITVDIKPELPPEEKIIPAPVIKKEAPVVTENKPVFVNEIGWWDKWLENNPDLEKFIGENLANKIGIAILVLGIGFFVKYAIDKEWINEAGRVIIGLACGGLLIGIAHFFRKTYRSFSSVLAGGGLAVFYFTIAFAFHQYHLMSQQAAFIIMVVITAFAVALSLLYDRLELAILAVIGGFIAPFLVSTGQDNYVALFTYLCILNSGMMVLAYFKKWPAINSISLIFTVIIYGGWLTNRIWYSEDKVFPYKEALLFATLFYVIFMLMNIINNLRLKRSFAAFDFIIVLSTNFLYYSAGMIILQYWNNGDYKGLFTALLGAINLFLAWLFFKNTKADKNFIYLLIGLTLTFISLAAPVQLKGNYITLFWSAEAVVLFWLYQQSRIKLLKVASLLVTILMLISLLMDWNQIYPDNNKLVTIIANKGFITSIVAACSLFIYFLLMKKEADSYYLPGITNRSLRNTLLIISIVITYISGLLEIWYQFSTRMHGTDIYSIYLQLYSFAFALIILIVFRNSKASAVLRFLLTLFCFAFYLFNLNINYEVIRNMLASGENKTHIISHWISAVLLFKLLYDLVIYFRRHHNTWKSYETPFTWIATGGIVLLLSVEIHHFIIWINYSKEDSWVYWQNLYYKAGLSILWGLCSFIMMWLGMKYKFRTLRIISLTLFSITVIKLFGYDIRNIPPGGKIAAFILLGVLLLTISFMYQRLKKMIIDDTKEEK